MTKDEIFALARKPKQGNRAKLSNPIQVFVGKSGHKNGSITLKIRDDVNSFKRQDRWNCVYIENMNRLYFFYGEPIGSHKVNKGSGYHYIKFTDTELEARLGKRVVNTYWKKDPEDLLYYIEITED